MITMKHKLAYIEAKALRTELNLMTRSHFIEIFILLTKCIRSRCPVDRVFRNCGVRNSEVLMYLPSIFAFLFPSSSITSI